MSLIDDITYNEKVKTVKSVILGVLSPERICQMSVGEVYKPVSQNEVLDGTLMDPRAGTNDKSEVNRVSGLDYKHDPGNWMHWVLPKPIYVQIFFDQLFKTLKCTCLKCSSILVDKSNQDLIRLIRSKKMGAVRFKFVYDLKKPAECPNCGAPQPTWSKGRDKNRVAVIMATFGKSDQQTVPEKLTFETEAVYYIMMNLSDEDAELMGYNVKYVRPVNFIQTVMLIPPPTMRPKIRLDNGQSSEDDLTSILNDLIKTGIALDKLMKKKDKTAKDKKDIAERTAILQLNHFAYINNEQSGMDPVVNRSNRPLKTLRNRIEAKKGRVRGNLMGKRVDYTARTVITADPNISIDQLGIPLKIAMILDYNETVTEYNLTTLYNLVQNGPKVYPGANAIKRRLNGKRINLEYADRTQIKLRPGDIVYRHLMDGDWVLFNRQPSLHKMSMMAHRAKIMKQGDTFRLNVSVTTPYNADFDGDEMNLHLPRSYQTRVELEELASVPTQICSPQASKPVMGLVQDSMLAVFRWTMSENYLNFRQVMNLLCWTSTYTGTLPPPDDPKKGWKAHSILSAVFPKFTLIQDDEEEEHKRVRIVHGEFEEGIMSSDSVGGNISKIIHAVWKDYGPETTRLFMDNMMNLTMQWLLIDGFSIGMIDTEIDKVTKKKVKEKTDQIYRRVQDKIRDVREGKFETKFSNVSLQEQFENEMFELVNEVRNKAQSMTYNSLDKNNRIYATVTSGSKGSKANIVQISSLLGQQVLEGGKRVHSGFYKRTLPHYTKDDLRPEAHGLILENYMEGLTPHAYFIHAMSGREGVISTAIKTGDTGYIQRKLVKMKEDLKVYYDGTVRNANGNIVSHIYGTDGFDSAKLERESLFYYNLDPNSDKFKEIYRWKDQKELRDALTKEGFKAWEDDVKNLGADLLLEEEIKQILEDRRILREEMYPSPYFTQHGNIYSPVKFSRLLNWVKFTCGLENNNKASVSPYKIIVKTRALLKDFRISHDQMSNELCTRHFKFLVRNYLNSKNLIVNYKFNDRALDLILLKIKEHYSNSLINPGEMIGCISAQSIGEPLTQLTLDNFHKSGLGNRSKKLSEVPRLKEVFSTTANQKTPFLRIYLKDETINLTQDTEDSLEQFIQRGENYLDKIQYTTLNNLTTGYQVVFDSDDNNSIIEQDRDWLQRRVKVGLIDPDQSESPWILRFVLNPEKIQNIEIEKIIETLESKLRTPENNMRFAYNSKNSAEVVIRIRVTTQTSNVKKELKDMTKSILLTKVKGIPNLVGGAVLHKDRDLEVDGRFISKESSEFRKIKRKDEKDGLEIINPFTQSYYIETEGTNLFDVLALDGIERYMTYSNNIHEVLEVLGIEAARELIVQEIVGVFAHGGKSQNNRHFGLLADIMTGQGYLISIDRYGVNKTDTGVLGRATFETTTNNIASAAIFGEEDPMRGVSANIMFGQFYQGGTNAFQVVLDEEMYTGGQEKLYFPKRKIERKTLELQEQDTLASCNNLDFEFSI